MLEKTRVAREKRAAAPRMSPNRPSQSPLHHGRLFDPGAAVDPGGHPTPLGTPVGPTTAQSKLREFYFKAFLNSGRKARVQAGVDRSSRNFALGPSAALAHRHVGVGKDAGHDAARAYQ